MEETIAPVERMAVSVAQQVRGKPWTVGGTKPAARKKQLSITSSRKIAVPRS